MVSWIKIALMPGFYRSRNRLFTLGACALSLGLALTSCFKTIPVPSLQVPDITGLQPISGPAQSMDTITGTGFGTQAAGDSVFFNGAPAAIVQASVTQLIVVVPSQGSTGAVTVKVGAFAATGPVFTYDTP